MPHIAHHQSLSINENGLSGLAAPPHGVRYHQQDEHGADLYCGAASAQILLASLGTSLLNQEDLYDSNTLHGTIDTAIDWDTAPDALIQTIDDFAPTGFTGTFTLWNLLSEEAISRKLCWAISQGIAPIALVQGGSHWIVVVGYTASADPTSASDTSYEIQSFDVYNPWPPITSSSATPPPHVDGSDFCGTSFTTGVNRGNEYETVPYKPSSPGAEGKYWRTFYMTPVRQGNWAGDYVAICDADPPANIQDTPLVLSDTRATDLDEIRDRAVRGLVDTGQNQRVPWSMGLEGTQVGDPLLVEREDLDPSRFYYIVPFHRGDSDVPVLAIVDAYEDGGLAGTITAQDGTTHFSGARSRADVIDEFVGQVVVEGSPETLKAEELYESLVWRPCVESLSHYWPFYRFDVGGPDGEIKVYVRIDGERFNELHPGFGM